MEKIDNGDTTTVWLHSQTPLPSGDIDLMMRLHIVDVERMFRSQSLVDLISRGVEANPEMLNDMPPDVAAVYEAACEDLLGFTRQLLGELSKGLVLGGHAATPN
jgi:hypothetical protein